MDLLSHVARSWVSQEGQTLLAQVLSRRLPWQIAEKLELPIVVYSIKDVLRVSGNLGFIKTSSLGWIQDLIEARPNFVVIVLSRISKDQIIWGSNLLRGS